MEAPCCRIIRVAPAYSPRSILVGVVDAIVVKDPCCRTKLLLVVVVPKGLADSGDIVHRSRCCAKRPRFMGRPIAASADGHIVLLLMLCLLELQYVERTVGPSARDPPPSCGDAGGSRS